MIRIAFVTGARSEYGVMKGLIRELSGDASFEISIIATGMHYLNKFGNTIEEIRKDNLAQIIDAPCYCETDQPKEKDFVSLIDTLSEVFSNNRFDLVYVLGDRLEAYAAALAAHFNKIPLAHFAGGQLTNGAVDNIYRYNISNLASIHFVTNIYAEERLKKCPIIDKSKVFMVGSSAVDSINKYLSNPLDSRIIDERLTPGSYVLATFHSETMSSGAGCLIPEIMDIVLGTLVRNGLKVLVTYPNNDDGSAGIIKIIKKWEGNNSIIVKKNLGAELYYCAVSNSLFVAGNSSSGIIEVPYFSKYTLDIGTRQAGRNAPKSVIHVSSDPEKVNNALETLLQKPSCELPQEYIYGKGDSNGLIHRIILKEFSC